MKRKRIWILGLVLVLAFSLLVGTSFAQQENDRIAIEINEDAIQAPDSLPLGTIILWMTNNSSQAQDIRVEGPNTLRTFTDMLEAGETRTIRLNVVPGTYRFSAGNGGTDLSADVEAGAGETGYASSFSFFGEIDTTPPVPIANAQQDQNQQDTSQQETGQESQEAPQADKEMMQQGEDVFASNCASCHGDNGQGGVGPALANNSFVSQDDPSPVIETVLHGRGRMPAFEDQLSNQDIAQVVSYIRNTWDNDASTVSAQQVSQVAEGGSAQQDEPDQATPTVTPSNQGDQQATATPTPSDQDATPTPTPIDEEDQNQQTTATPTPTEEENQEATETPVAGSEIVQTEGTVQEPIEETTPIGLEEVAQGFTSPIFLTNAGDDSGRLFVVDQVGQIRIIDDNGELLEEPFLDVSDRMVELMEDFDERGLLGLAFHPEYEQNGRFFVYYSAPLREEAPDDWNHTGHISEFSVSEGDENMADPDSERVLMMVDEPQFNHDGGTLMFGPDGYLYISLGDGGDANDTGLGHVEDWYEENDGGNAQSVEENLLGKILRIDVDSEGQNGKAYGIPEDNPFAGEAGLDEIYAYGLRNPYRFSFDRGGDNQLFAADVGQNNFEEVSIIESGGNYGWNVKEGTHCFDASNPNDPPAECPEVVGGDHPRAGDPLIDPVIEYLNANKEGGLGISITGGFVYRGEMVEELQGNYVFGDWSKSFEGPQGRLFMSEPQDGEGLWPIVELLPEGMEFNEFVMGFGEDESGELYVTTTQTVGPTGNTGRIFRLVPADGSTSDGDGQIPVTGEEPRGFSVADVAQPGQSGEIDLEVALVHVADGFNDPVNVVIPPDGSGRMFVVERNGVVRVVTEDGEVMDEPFLDISDQTLDAFLEQGLYDLAFHPDFANNGRFFVHFAELLRNGDSMIVEYTVSDDDENAADPESARMILQIDQPWANHNGGELAFGPDGYLYIASGDGGWEGDPLHAGQDLSTLLGKILRIDVDQSSGYRNYGIPEDNPFASRAGLVRLFGIDEETFANIHAEAQPEIWAYGLRNPWKFQFDPETGDLYLPDVGQNHWEEINFQPADSEGGANYGWDILMGTRCFPISAEDCPAVGVLPVAEYNHDLGVAAVGLGVYRGDEFPEMDGIYFVADWGSGRIWGLQRGGTGDENGNGDNAEWTFAELLDTDTRITGSGQAEDGTIYVTTCNCEYGGGTPTENQPGALWRLVPADQVPEDAETAGGEIPVTGSEEQDQQQEATATTDQNQDEQATATSTPSESNNGSQDSQQAAPGQLSLLGFAIDFEEGENGELYLIITQNDGTRRTFHLVPVAEGQGSESEEE